MNPTQQAAAFRSFLLKWLAKTVPGLIDVRVDRKTGAVKAKDSLGWRDVGTLADFIPLARALGAI